MESVGSLEVLARRVSAAAVAVVYFSRPGCGVCSALRPKIESLLARFPRLSGLVVDLETVPAAAAEYSIFTIPAVLLFVDGKESRREARYLSLDDFAQRLRRLYNLRFDLEAGEGEE